MTKPVSLVVDLTLLMVLAIAGGIVLYGRQIDDSTGTVLNDAINLIRRCQKMRQTEV